MSRFSLFKTVVLFFKAFTVVMQTLQYSNPDWLAKLMKPLSEGDQESLKEVVKLSEKRKEARKSRDIEKQGGKDLKLLNSSNKVMDFLHFYFLCKIKFQVTNSNSSLFPALLALLHPIKRLLLGNKDHR